MSLPSEWMPCLEVMGILALEITLIVAAAAVWEQNARSVLWRRAIWQTAVTAVFLLFVAELSGLSRDMAALGWSYSEQSMRLMDENQAVEAYDPASSPALPFPATSAFKQKVAAHLAHNRLEFQPSLAVSPAGQPSQAFAFRNQHAAEPFFQGHTLPWPAVIWAIGAGAALGPVALGWLVFVVFHRKSRPVRDDALQRRIAFLAGKLGVHRRVGVFESPRLRGPIAYGVLRPTIGLPLHFAEHFSAAHQDAMLAHELAHLAAHDSAWQRLGDIAASMLWWHPLVWWSRHRLRTAEESAADEASLLVGDGPGLLAECLVNLASHVEANPPSAWVQATGPGFRSDLGKRIHRLVSLEHRAWSPLSRASVWTVRILVPAALVTAATLCTAWIKPPEPGECMKTIKQTWNRSLATLALFAAFSVEPEPAHANDPQPQNVAPPPNAFSTTSSINATTLLTDARLLLEMNKLDAAEAKLQQAMRANPPDPNASRYLKQIAAARASAAILKASGIPRPTGMAVAGEHTPLMAAAAEPESPTPPAAAPVPPPAEEPAPEEQAPPQDLYRMDPRLLERYGLRPRVSGGRSDSPNAVRSSRGKQQVEAKLNQIILNEVMFDGLPLSEIVKFLQDEARRRDTTKPGLNFLISNVPAIPNPGIDPTTGMPLPAANLDVASMNISLHLRDVRMKDVLDALTRVADHPLKYSVEDYGVVISPGAGQPGAPAFALASPQRSEEAQRLLVRTFSLDTNTFIAGLESAFGIKLGTAKDQAARGKEIQQALRDLLTQLGTNMDAPKAVFYNGLTGILMIRASAEDLELAQAAIETLGGQSLRIGVAPGRYGGYGSGYGSGQSYPPPGGRAGTPIPQPEKQGQGQAPLF